MTVDNSNSPTAKQRSKSPPDRLVNLLCLLMVIAISASVFLWHQSLTQYRELLEQQKLSQIALNDTNKVLTNLQKEISELKSKQHSKTQQLEQQQKQINHLQISLNQDESAWRLTRIDYLVQLANYQTVFMHNAKKALALLTAANQEVANASQPQWLALATALHSDIDALKVIPVINVDDLMSELVALDSQLNQLPLTVSQFNQTKLTKPVNTTANTHVSIQHWAWWREKLIAVWQQLRNILVIRHNDKAIVPIIDEQQQAYLRQNLHLILFQTKWALLDNNNALYHSSLDQLTQWIEDYFNMQSPVAKAVLDSIEGLKKHELTRELPTPTASLKVLQKIMNNANAHPKSPTPPTELSPATSKLQQTPNLSQTDAQPEVTHS